MKPFTSTASECKETQVHYKEVLRKGWLYAEAFNGKDYDLTIKSITKEKAEGHDSEDGDFWLVARFHETSKKLSLNITNCESMETATGTAETDDWVGVTFTFFAIRGRFFGKKGQAIRVRTKLPAQKFKGVANDSETKEKSEK